MCAHTHTHTHTHTYTKPTAGHYRLTPLPETPRLSQAGLAQSLVGSLRLSPLMCTRSCFCLQESLLPPVLWKSCNEIPVTFKVRFLGESESPCQIPSLGSLLWGLEPHCNSERTSLCNCSSACGPPTWRIYGRTNGDLLRGDLGHTLRLPGLLLPEPPSPQQPTANPGLCRDLKHSPAGLAQSPVGVTAPFPWVLVHRSFSLCLQESLVGTGFDFNMTACPTFLSQLLLCA